MTKTPRGIKDLRKALPPLREARAILGDVLMGAGDDDKLRDAFISTDYVIEHVELATDPSRRSKPRPLDPTTIRGTGQRASGFRDALRLLREARVFIIAAREAAGEWHEGGAEGLTETEAEALLNTYENAFSAEMRIGYAIEGVRALMGLPPDPLMVLEAKQGAVFRASIKERKMADAECPEMQRLLEEMGRRDLPFEEWMRLDGERERIVETNDRYAEVRRLEEESDLISQEIVRIGEADPTGLRAIDSAAGPLVRDLAMKSRW